MLKDSAVVEILKYAGFEWLVVDLEHTDLDLQEAKLLIATIQAAGMEALVRVSKNEEVVIKRVLDMGADGIIVPMVCSRKDADQAVGYSKYPPKGKRGVGLSRAQCYGLEFEEYKKWVDEQLVIIAQIEHIDAVRNIEQLVDVADIDCFMIGPYDMSASMGYPGEFDRQDVKEAVSKVFQVCIAKKKSVGFHVVDTRADAIWERINQGGNFMAYGIDYFFLRDKAIECMKQLKQRIKE